VVPPHWPFELPLVIAKKIAGEEGVVWCKQYFLEKVQNVL
jgi:hypothetical protein